MHFEINKLEEMAVEMPIRKTRKNLPKHVTLALKTWMRLHRHHPYPTDWEKLQMARLYGLSVTQINNWFINSRRRYFKKELASTVEENVLIPKRGARGVVQRKRQGYDSENYARSPLSSPGTSMSEEEFQNSDTSESSLPDSSASSGCIPYVDKVRLIVCKVFGEKEYRVEDGMLLLCDVAIARDQVEKQLLID